MRSYILFYDSGLGGLSTLKAGTLLMPNESYIYFADDQNMPYGNKSRETLIKLIYSNIKTLSLKYPLKAIVLSCNTATSVAKSFLQTKFSIPIIGIEPALMPATRLSKTGQILCLATKATISGDKYLLLKAKTGIKVYSAAMYFFAKRIEDGLIDNALNIDEEIAFIKEVIEKYPDISHIVLGCTHYSLVSDIIEKAAGRPVVDGNLGVARRLRALLKARGDLKNKGFMNLKIILSSGSILKEKQYLDIFENIKV